MSAHTLSWPIAKHRAQDDFEEKTAQKEHKLNYSLVFESAQKLIALTVGLLLSFLIARLALLLVGNTGGDIASDTIFKLTDPLIKPFQSIFSYNPMLQGVPGLEIVFCLVALFSIAILGWIAVSAVENVTSKNH